MTSGGDFNRRQPTAASSSMAQGSPAIFTSKRRSEAKIQSHKLAGAERIQKRGPRQIDSEGTVATVPYRIVRCSEAIERSDGLTTSGREITEIDYLCAHPELSRRVPKTFTQSDEAYGSFQQPATVCGARWPLRPADSRPGARQRSKARVCRQQRRAARQLPIPPRE
jgi:hypothetical protein